MLSARNNEEMPWKGLILLSMAVLGQAGSLGMGSFFPAAVAALFLELMKRNWVSTTSLAQSGAEPNCGCPFLPTQGLRGFQHFPFLIPVPGTTFPYEATGSPVVLVLPE